MSSPLPIKARTGPGSKQRKAAVSPYRDREPPFDPDPTKDNPSPPFRYYLPIHPLAGFAVASSTQLQAFIVQKESRFMSVDFPLHMSCCISLMSGWMQRRVSVHYHDYFFCHHFWEGGGVCFCSLSHTLHMQNTDQHRQHTPSFLIYITSGRFRSFYWPPPSFLFCSRPRTATCHPHV